MTDKIIDLLDNEGRENKMDLVYHRAKSKKQKRQNRLNREELLGNQAFQPINDPITPNDNLNDCEQTVEFMLYYYDNGERYEWTTDDKNKVNEALRIAIAHLNKALNEDKIKSCVVILEAIKDVIGVLQASDLKIYPFQNHFGQAQKDLNEISINMDKLRRTSRILAKTLIHEAFHIIGGCRGDNDETCDNNMSKLGALSKIINCSIEDMQADHFAQFVMKC